MYREKYAQKRAIQLYTAGSSREAVLVMLQEEGATPDQVEELANKYYKLYLLLRREDAKQELKIGRMLTSIGAVFLAIGVGLTVLSLLYFSNGSYLVYYGLMGLGCGLLYKGSVAKKKGNNMLQQG